MIRAFDFGKAEILTCFGTPLRFVHLSSGQKNARASGLGFVKWETPELGLSPLV